MAIMKIVVIILTLAFVHGSSIVRQRSADECEDKDYCKPGCEEGFICSKIQNRACPKHFLKFCTPTCEDKDFCKPGCKEGTICSKIPDRVCPKNIIKMCTTDVGSDGFRLRRLSTDFDFDHDGDCVYKCVDADYWSCLKKNCYWNCEGTSYCPNGYGMTGAAHQRCVRQCQGKRDECIRGCGYRNTA